MNKHKLIFRIIADIAMIFLIAWAPLWAVVIFAAAFAWIFVPYYEIVFAGLAFDSIYGSHSFYGVTLAFVIFAIIELLKKKTRI